MHRKEIAVLGLLATLLLVSCGSHPQPITAPIEVLADSQPAPTKGDNVASNVAEHLRSEDRESAENQTELAWSGNYAGKLDDKIEVSLALHGLGDDVRGTITYKKSGKPIIVLGTMNTDGTFFLREYQPDGNITGVLSGTERAQKLAGTWYAPNTDRELSLSLEAVTVQEEGTVEWPYAAQNVSGPYGYHYGKDGPLGSLTVKQVGDKVRFSMNCLTSAPGRNMALLENLEAPLEEGVARYKMPTLDCEFVIRFYDGFAVVKYVDEHYDCEFGHNATIEGEFVKLK